MIIPKILGIFILRIDSTAGESTKESKNAMTKGITKDAVRCNTAPTPMSTKIISSTFCTLR